MGRNVKVIGEGRPQAGPQGSDRSDRGPAAPSDPRSTNRGSSTSHAPENEHGGIDTITISMFGEYLKPEATFAWLQSGQENAQKNPAAENEDIIHYPHGCKAVGSYCRWQVTFRGLHFVLTDKVDTVTGNQPSLQVQIHSRDLLNYGYGGAMKIAYEFCCILNFRVVGEKVNRVDVCVDVFIPVHEFAEGFFRRKYITRARKWQMYGSMDDENVVTETINFGMGASAIKCRIYDKIAETERSELKRALMVERRWSGSVPEHATRVEFQVTGKALREQFNIRDLRTLEQKIGQVCRFLTTEWLKFIPEPNDGKHYDRKEPSEAWQRVQQAFQRWAGVDLRKRERPIKHRPCMKRLVKGLFGYASSFYANHGSIPVSSDDFLNELRNAARVVWNDFVSRTIEKRNKMSATLGVDVTVAHSLDHPAWSI